MFGVVHRTTACSRRRASVLTGEGLEPRTLLTITSQSAYFGGGVSIDGAATKPNPVSTITQTAGHIAGINVAYSDTATVAGKGENGSYVLSLTSKISQSTPGADAGTIAISTFTSTTSSTQYQTAGSNGLDTITGTVSRDSIISLNYTYSSSVAANNYLEVTPKYTGSMYDKHYFFRASGTYTFPIAKNTSYQFQISASSGHLSNVFSADHGATTAALGSVSWKVGSVQKPALVMNDLSLSSNGQNVNANYMITGSALPSPGTIDFYWASGPNLTDKLGSGVSIKTKTAVGSYTASLPVSKLGPRPENASYIVAVADSPNADSAHDVTSVKAKTLQPISAQTGEAIERKSVQVVSDYKARGVTYLLGGNASNGGKTSDCTNFISDVLKQSGLTIPYTATAQFAASIYYEVIPASEARAGDIMVQGSHAGIFTGTFDSKKHPLGAEMGDHGPVVFAPWGPGGWFDQPTTLKYYRPLQLQ